MTDLYNISLRCMVKRHGLLAVLAELQTITEERGINPETAPREAITWAVCGDAIEECVEQLADDLGRMAHGMTR